MEESNQMAEQAAVQTQELMEKAAEKPADQPKTDFDTLDYVKELFLQGVEQQKRDRKKLRMIRACMIFMGIICLTMIISTIVVVPYVQTALADVHDLSQMVLSIDVKSITDDAAVLITDATTAVNTIGDAALKVQDFDVESLNSAISSLTKTVDNFGKIDMASLNTSIETLSKVTKAFGEIKILGKPLLG